jgi:hypothetical protein
MVGMLGYFVKYQNAHKHWLSGWFENRTVTLNVTMLPWDGNEQRLASYVDYSNNELFLTDVVLIVFDDIYIQYNRAKGYNIDSIQPANVAITQANDTMSRSSALADLTAGQSFLYNKRNNGTNDSNISDGIIIDFCNTSNTSGSVDYAVISIYLDDGLQLSKCRQNVYTSTEPTMSPSIFPSTITSFSPTLIPSATTNSNSTAPELMRSPSEIPSSKPEKLPTGTPSLPPDEAQNPAPTLNPSRNSSLIEESPTTMTSGAIEQFMSCWDVADQFISLIKGKFFLLSKRTILLGTSWAVLMLLF